MTDWDHTPPEGQPYNPAPPPMPPGASPYPPDPAGNQPYPPAQPPYQPPQPQYQQPQYQQPQYQQPAYQQPAYQQPAAPQAPVPGYPPAPTGGGGGRNQKKLLLIGGVGLLVVLALVAGYTLLGGPDTVSEREFAAAACNIQKEWSETLDDAMSNSDVLDRLYSDDLSSKRDVEEAHTFMVGFIGSTEGYLQKIRDLVDTKVIDHEDGEALREDLLESYDTALAEASVLKERLDDIDTGSSSGGDDLVDLWQDDSGDSSDIGTSSRTEDLARDINERMADLDSDCAFGIAPGASS